jgi:HD superfamily phosphohydrolase
VRRGISYTKYKKRKAKWVGRILRRKCLLKQVIEGKIEADRSDKKTRKKT